MAAVTLVTIHHEGAGSCTNDPSRYAHGGYTYGIGCTNWTRLRSVGSSYATLGFNGTSADVCVSGNRMTAPFTTSDVELIRQAIADCRARGEVVGNPTVRAHRNSPGSSTVCPGDNVMKLWDQVVAACQAGGTPPTPQPPPSQTGGAPLTTVAQGRVRNGRQGTARPVPAFGTVVLENGASCQGDAASGQARVWVNPDPIIKQTNALLVDICPTVDSAGRPDGAGFVALYDLRNGQIGTYRVPWS